ncbi:MAG: hypothetical protein ABFS42_00190 [Candidatus Krumholzibacteriota bacterium]
MQKFIHNVALLASFVVLSCGLWQDWGAWLTVKRMFVSYMGFFICGSGLFLAFRAVLRFESGPRDAKSDKSVGRVAKG